MECRKKKKILFTRPHPVSHVRLLQKREGEKLRGIGARMPAVTGLNKQFRVIKQFVKNVLQFRKLSSRATEIYG